MSWIKTIPYDKAKGKLKDYYERVKGPEDNVDNILLAHSLRPHTLMGHMTLYKSVLHHRDNKLPKQLLESLGVYVSHMNRCYYCVEHHFEGLKRLMKNDEKAEKLRQALERNNLEAVFSPKELAMFKYARELTMTPYRVLQETIEEMREAGLKDGEILEVNQLVAYFNYANRTVLGLGVDTVGDILGQSPSSDDPDEWGHQ